MPDPSETRSSDPGQIIDELCDQLEDGWRAESPPAIADLIAFAAEPIRPTLFCQLLPIEMEYRAKAGRPLSAGEARSLYGGLGPWVAEIIKDLLAGTTGDWSSGDTPSHGQFSAALDPSAEPLPAQIGKFRVIRRLGGGGMGVVYLARDPDGHHDVAVKVMRREYAANPIARERFLREARSAMTVREHDHIVPVYQVEENGGSPFLVMPVLKGESLEERLNREPRPPLELVLQVGREVALGLAAAHDKGLVHRDVKPGNIWLEGDPASPFLAEQVRRVKVLDFGLARAVDHTGGASVTGSIVGTAAYMAPEQARGERVDARADLFSLGVVLYRMTAGRPAFTGATLTAILTQIATHQPPPPTQFNAAIPPALSALVMRLLDKDPSTRPGLARTVVDALTAIKNGQPISPPKDKRRKRWVVGVGVLLALCLAAVAVSMLVRETRPDGKAPTVATGTGPSPGTDPRPPDLPKQEALRVKSLDVMHFARSANADVERGVLGQKSFSPLLGDKVRVVAKLSRPAYAYIMAFRPDGVAELCFPNDEDTVPPLTDTPRYPAADNSKAYGLDEGAGLWVFAVVASEQPLPTYRQWLASRKPDWKSEEAPTGVVWWYDGALLETLFESGSTARGKDVELKGPASTVRSLGLSLEQSSDTKIGIVGFGVGKRN
jgi:serine/threonine protein kinase